MAFLNSGNSSLVVNLSEVSWPSLSALSGATSGEDDLRQVIDAYRSGSATSLDLLGDALLNSTPTTTSASVANVTGPEEIDYQFYYFYKTEQLTFLWILFVMIVVGNCSVLITLLMSKNRKTRMNFFLMHLAFADLLVGLINVLTDIAWRTTVGFYAGNIACKVVKFLQVLVTYSSTYVLVSLTIDRYDAITHPLNFSGSWRRARWLVVSAWGLSAVFSVPAIFLNEEVMVKGHPQCWINLEPWQWQLYITLVALSLFFMPAVIISACYSIIVHTIWTKSRLMGFPKAAHKSETPNKKQNKSKPTASAAGVALNEGDPSSTSTAAPATANSNGEHEADFKRASSRGVIPRAKIKTVKMTFVIVFVFVICWSPYFVWDLLQVYGFIPLSQTTIAVSTFIQSMAPLNSAANPIIYCLFSTHICRNLRKLSIMRCLSRAFCLCCPNLQRPLRGSAMKRLDYATMNSTTTRGSSGSRNTQRFSLTSSSRSSSSTMKKTVVFRNSLDEVPEGARPAAAAAENVAPGDGIEELDNGDSIEVAPQHHAQLRRQRSTDESNSFSEEATFANSVL